MTKYIEHTKIKPNTIEAKLYQEVLAARCLEKGNTLIVAPTALGKTIIAILVSAEILQKGKKILFLAPTKPLVLQHAESFKKFLNINEEEICTITGVIQKEKRKDLFQKCNIVCATPQAIQNDIYTGDIILNDFGLIVFDEAHKAIGNYSYVFIAEKYVQQAKDQLILALTASPGSDQEKIQSICRNLFIKNVEIKTAKDEDVKEYVNEIKVSWVRVSLPEKFLTIKKLLKEFQQEQLESLKKIGIGIGKKYFSKKDILALQSQVRREIILKGKQMPSLYGASMKLASLLKISHAEELLETQGIETLVSYFQKIFTESNKRSSTKSLKSLANDERIKKAFELAKKAAEEKISHPKIEATKSIIIKQLKEKPESRIIVFNHYRDNIIALEEHLSKVEGIKVKRFVGQATKGEDKGLTQKEQAKIIKEFKEGNYNCLLASSVAEEGLDIPEVELVIFYEPVPSEIRMIQRRGRTGRKSEGKVIILITRDTRDEAFYFASIAKEKNMYNTLKQLQNQEAIPQKISNTQTKITDFETKEITIYVDTREQASRIIPELQNYGMKVIIKQLEVGDFVLSNDVVIERKTISDFLSSLADGRLFNQLALMSSTYSAPLIILEGNYQEIFTERNFHENSIRGALSSIALNYRIPIIQSSGFEETAKYIFLIAKREQLGEEKEIRLRTGKKGLTLQEQQQYILEGFPMIGPSLAKALLKKFGTIRAIMSATIQELQEV
ncbi:MAG: DEAD/DEAH box helicase, partial [Candidatus Diapherotrites archaeon]